MTKTMETAIETLKANNGSIRYFRGIKGFNLKAVDALIARGVFKTEASTYEVEHKGVKYIQPCMVVTFA